MYLCSAEEGSRSDVSGLLMFLSSVSPMVIWLMILHDLFTLHIGGQHYYSHVLKGMDLQRLVFLRWSASVFDRKDTLS